ncbi:MAG: hypothetical protein HOI21_02780 [Bacteroidetes Order II. Incertae sedis bacterium]|jgi:hypothetical protein|nr:hypothetical protein [Bacteroidetes Order II. bacterium]
MKEGSEVTILKAFYNIKLTFTGGRYNDSPRVYHVLSPRLNYKGDAQMKDFLEKIKSRLSPGLISEILGRTLKIQSQSGSSLRAACPFHHGDSKSSFWADMNTGRWTCHSQCAKSGDIISFMAGGENPKGQEFKTIVFELARIVGLDSSAFQGNTASKAWRPKKSKRSPPKYKVEPVRDLKPIHPCISLITTTARTLFQSRVPGLLSEDYDGTIINGWIGSPCKALDQADPKGAYQTGKRGHQLMLPMRSLEEPEKISSAQYRWTREAPAKKKTLLHHGSSGGQFGAVFGNVQEALNGAAVVGHLVITEGDFDTLTLAAMGSEYHIGIAGAARLPKIIKFLRSIFYQGKVIACVDRDPTGESVLARAYKEAKGSGIELYDGRPPVEGQDINDVFSVLGGSQGSRAVVKLIEEAPHCRETFPDVRLPLSEELEAEVSKISGASPWVQELKDLNANEAKNRRRRFKSFSALAWTLSEMRLLSEKAVVAFVRILMVEGLSDISRAQVKSILEEAFPKSEFSKRFYQEAEANTGGFSVASSTRYTLKSTHGHLFLRALHQLADATNRQTVQVIEWADVFRSVDRSDRSYVRFSGTVEDCDFSKKLASIASCATFQTDTCVDDVTRADHGEYMRGHRNACSNSQCGWCQGIYCASQANYNRISPGWNAPMIMARVAADEDSPASTAQVWNEYSSKLRKAEIRGVTRPTMKDMDISADVLFFAQDTDENKQLFEKSFGGTLVEMSGEEALNIFSFSCSLVALRISTKIIQREVDFFKDPWLGFVKIARKRGPCASFPWLSLSAWKQRRKDLSPRPEDNRPGIQTSYHAESKIIIHEQTTDKIPLHHHELVKIAGLNSELNQWQDDRFRQDLGSHMALVLIAKRRKIRENREKYAEHVSLSNPLNL